MEIAHTRAMINAILKGELNGVETETDPVFGLHIPKSVRDVPDEVLNPRNTWKRKQDYDKTARALATQFVENFTEYENSVKKEILAASPNPTAPVAKGRTKVQKLRG
jgi:phosphoenolpyruvate carboxykinase (ATP)